MVTVAVLEISCSMAVMSRLPLLVLLTKTTTTNTVGSVLCDTGYFFLFFTETEVLEMWSSGGPCTQDLCGARE